MSDVKNGKEIKKCKDKISYLSATIRGFRGLNGNVGEIKNYLDSAVNEYESLINKVKHSYTIDGASMAVISELEDNAKEIRLASKKLNGMITNFDDKISSLSRQLYNTNKTLKDFDVKE